MDVKRGYEAIDNAIDSYYKNTGESKLYTINEDWMYNKTNGLFAVEVIKTDSYFHFITYGFSEINGKVTNDLKISGMGFELTLRLKKDKSIDEKEILNIINILCNLFEIAFNTGRRFGIKDVIYTGQQTGLDAHGKSNISGFITKSDVLGRINSVNGDIQFVELVGMTKKELATFMDSHIELDAMIEKMADDFYTDYSREDIIKS